MTAYELNNIKRALMSPDKINRELAVIMAVGQGMTATELSRLYAKDLAYKEGMKRKTGGQTLVDLWYELGGYGVFLRDNYPKSFSHLQCIVLHNKGVICAEYYLKNSNPKHPYKADVFCQMIEGFLKESNVKYKP